MESLLSEPVFSIGSDAPVTLPGLLAALSRRDKAVRLAGIRLHQVYAAHTFLTQLAALALADSDRPTPTEEKAWTELLLKLTKGHPTAWDLVVSDPTKPAFCQPPVHGEPLGKWLLGPGADPTAQETDGWALQRTPDETDVYNTAANHSPKARAMTSPSLEHWVYTLISLQTTAPTTSRYTYRATRVGSTGRVFCGVRSGDLDEGTWFRRDLAMLRAQRQHQLRIFSANGHAILWLIPWDGTEADQLKFNSLDPNYLDIARIIRLVKSPFGGPYLMARTSKSYKAKVQPMNGNVGDPWTPLQNNKKTKTAGSITTDETGWRYDKIHQIMWGGEFPPPAATGIQLEDGPEPVLYVAGIVVDPTHQANSLGFHERMVAVPPHYLTREGEAHTKMAERSDCMIKAVNAVEDILQRALGQFFPNQQKSVIPSFIDEFDRAVDAMYFEFLFGGSDLAEWNETLFKLATRSLEKAEGNVPITRRIRASAMAFNVFEKAKTNIGDNLHG
jgi:CRISPR system Cascade subunit CasA